jgi:hypothetical protein
MQGRARKDRSDSALSFSSPSFLSIVLPSRRRIKNLESTVSNIQTTLLDLVSAIKSGLPGLNNASSSSPQPGTSAPSPSYPSHVQAPPSHQPAFAYPDGTSFDPSASSSSSHQPPSFPRSNSFQSKPGSNSPYINPYANSSSHMSPSISSASIHHLPSINNGGGGSSGSYLARFSADGVLEPSGPGGYRGTSPAGMSDPNSYPSYNPSTARPRTQSNNLSLSQNYALNAGQPSGSTPSYSSSDSTHSSAAAAGVGGARHPSSHLSGPPITNPYSPPKHPLPLPLSQQVPSSAHSHSTNAYLNSLQASSTSSLHADSLTRSLHAHLNPLHSPARGPSTKPKVSSARNTPANSDVDTDSEGEGEGHLPTMESDLASTAPLNAMGRLADAATSGLMLLAGEGERAMKKARFDVSDTSGKGKGRERGRGGNATDGGVKGATGPGGKKDPFLEGPGMGGGEGGPPIGADGKILDCIEAGVVSEEDARQLVAI